MAALSDLDRCGRLLTLPKKMERSAAALRSYREELIFDQKFSVPSIPKVRGAL